MSKTVAPPFSFEITHKSKKSNARAGIIHTPHGKIHTPSFVAVGTNGTLKAIDNEMVSKIGLELMFCNTYHLMLQPGTNVVKEAGGLHKFINRNLPIITDSGGFQVFSLAFGGVANELKSKGNKKTDGQVLKITEEGVTFRSYRSGEKILLTPETSIQAQKDLGADIIIPFDELPPFHISKEQLKKSLDRTHRWEIRSLKEHLQSPNDQAMYAVIHGGIDDVMREESIKTLSAEPFDGFAFGGSFGTMKKEMIGMLKVATPKLPEEKPIHLLGIADLPSLHATIPIGIDTFDSSYPTKAARHGTLLTSAGSLKVTRGVYANDHNPVDPKCSCYTCQNYSLAYINHLFKAKEVTGHILATIHNLHFMVSLMQTYRQCILDDQV